MNDRLKLAKFYAAHGWQIFPCVPRDKLPMVRWADMATTEENQITGWWDTQPDANIGLATGARSGVIVLDVDPDKGGDLSLTTLQAAHGALPDTVLALTGGGGRHYLFAHPGTEIRNSAGLLGPGLDIRGDGGYIVAPGSIHPNGKQYRWDADHLPSQTTLAPMPQWLVDELLTRHKAHAPQTDTSGMMVYIEGGRNQALTSLAGTMRRRGFGHDAILAALTAENSDKCFPPLDDSEIETIAKSVASYAPTAPPVTHQPAQVGRAVSALDGLLELSGRLDTPPEYISSGIPALDLRLGGLPRKNTIVLAARPSVGKTTLCWQIARNVAASGRRVLFLSLEMAGSQLWEKAAFGIAEVTQAAYRQGEIPPRTVERMRTQIIPELIDNYNDNLLLYDTLPCDTAAVWKLTDEYTPELIILDHLATLSDKHESEIRRLGLLMQSLGSLAKERDLPVIIIHHLSRAVEQRQNKEPHLSDLRASGEIEQIADIVIMPHRPDYADIHEGQPRYSETRLLIRKNREGESGFAVGLYYDMLRQWFYAKTELPGGTIL